MTRDHVAVNRSGWNAESDTYQEQHASQLDDHPFVWGVWGIPESEVNALGELRGKDVLELGCGAAQWAGFLARDGVRVTGLDASERQLTHARRFLADLGVTVPLIHANAERLPLADASFDVVFCDHGATSFTDPHRSVPEAARVLRPGGRFVFNIGTPIRDACWNEATDRIDDRLHEDYFALHRLEDETSVCFQLPYGEWIRLFRRSGLRVEDLIELRPGPDATTTYPDYVPLDWARKWPAEGIWVLEKE